jgi:archaemetzincin
MMTVIMQIILQPILCQLSKDIISQLENILSEEFSASVTNAPIEELSEQFFDKQRNQWKSSDILQWLSDKLISSKSTKILALCDFDAYSGRLNFVLGEAYLDGSISAIYLPRLTQEFYRLKSDESLYHQRILKEAVHELGHAFGLNHCKNIRCVMHFSNSLSDTDIKTSHFCNVCKGHLEYFVCRDHFLPEK